MKQSELLRKQADMIDLAEKHGIEWQKLFKMRISGEYIFTADEKLYQGQIYKFALGVVEGKPVFEGDELYNVQTGFRFTATELTVKWERFSWNPPKPKTIMVELLFEDAEFYMNSGQVCSNLAKACRKALESIKQS